MLVLLEQSVSDDTGSTQSTVTDGEDSESSETSLCSGDCRCRPAVSSLAGLNSDVPETVLESANLACTLLLDASGDTVAAIVVVRRGDSFNGDTLEPSVLDRLRSALGDAASEREGDDQADIRSELLGEDGGVSRSCAILCKRFWMPAKSICNLLSRLSSVPGKPEFRRVGDVDAASLHDVP